MTLPEANNAVYTGLMTLFNLFNNPHCKVEVRSDSLLVINQINNKVKCKDDSLKNRRGIIQEFVRVVPVDVEFKWRPRCSNPALSRADYLAKEALGVV